MSNSSSTDPIDRAREQFALGRALQQQGEAPRALEHFRRAAELAPQNVETANAIGACLRDLGELEAAIASFHRGLQIAPDTARIHNNLALALQDQGKLDEAIASFRRALELESTNAGVHSNLLLCLNYHEGYTDEQIRAEHQTFARMHGPPPGAARPLTARPRSVDGRLRIGYLSPDFFAHSVSLFMMPVLGNHDRSRVQVTCYCDVRRADEATAILRGLAERWRDVSALSDDQLARLIDDDQIDILVELSGHSRHNRLPLLARRVAPTQVTYLGYPNTTGLANMDYRITDALADPSGMTEALHSERVVRLPETFFVGVRMEGGPEVGPSPARSRGSGDGSGDGSSSDGGITFAVMNNFPKVRPSMMTLWAQILSAVRGSKLMLNCKSMADPPTRQTMLRFFAGRGLRAEQLELRGRLDFGLYLRQFAEVDILLDTFPFNGHTTTFQALWMGVPVVTLAGSNSRSRMGASILTNLGLKELIAADPPAYVKIATDLAKDLPRLADLRGGLRQRMIQSPLMATARFTRHLEDAYQQMATNRNVNVNSI